MIALILITNLIFPPARPPVKQNARTSAPQSTPSQQSIKQAAAATTSANQPAQLSGRDVIVQSPLYRYAISVRGGALTSAEMLKFKSFTRNGPVQLVGRKSPLVSYEIRADKDHVIDLRN